MALSVSTRRDGTMATVVPSGEVDLASVGQLEQAIADGVGEQETTTILVDLAEVSFLDSTGIAALLKGRRLADHLGKRYSITGAQGLVSHVLELAGVAAHLAGPAD